MDELKMNNAECRMKTRNTGSPRHTPMKRNFIILICLMLVLALTACQSKTVDQLMDDYPDLINMPTGVPGEPEGVPLDEING